MKRLLLVISSLGLVAGCGGSVISAPRVASPVLLGPVDRVGGHRANATVGETFDAHGESSFMISSAEGGLYTSAFRTPRVAGTWAILDKTSSAADDVHIEAIKARGFVWDAFGFFWMDNSVTLKLAVARKEISK